MLLERRYLRAPLILLAGPTEKSYGYGSLVECYLNFLFYFKAQSV